VIVATVTSPAFNAVLPLASALVVEHGGLVSHAALVARALGIPAVVGVRGATESIEDGERIQVDAGNGRVVRLAVRRSVEAVRSDG
jgi:pyruvate,water dikinase